MSKYLKCADVLDLWDLIGTEAKDDFDTFVSTLSDKDEAKIDNAAYNHTINFVFNNYDVKQIDQVKVANFAKKIRPVFVVVDFLDKIFKHAPDHIPTLITVYDSFKSNAVLKKLSNLIVRTEHLFPDFDAINIKVLLNMSKFEKIKGTNLLVERLSTSIASGEKYNEIAVQVALKAGFKDEYHDWVKATNHINAISELPKKQFKTGKNPLLSAYNIKTVKSKATIPTNIATTERQTSSIESVLKDLSLQYQNCNTLIQH